MEIFSILALLIVIYILVKVLTKLCDIKYSYELLEFGIRELSFDIGLDKLGRWNRFKVLLELVLEARGDRVVFTDKNTGSVETIYMGGSWDEA